MVQQHFIVGSNLPAEVRSYHAIEDDAVTQLNSYSHSELACVQPGVIAPPEHKGEHKIRTVI